MAETTGVNNNNNSLVQKPENYVSNSPNNNNALDKDAFLKLLSTQLANQDPLNPLKDNEFIAQMAQFSSLEQMQNMNKAMELNTVLLSRTKDAIEAQGTSIKALSDNQDKSLKNETELINQLIKLNKAIEKYHSED